MRNYEIIFIANPDLDDEALAALVERVEGWIKETGGTISQTDVWGRKRMAYRIRKQRDGLYVYILAAMHPAAVVEIERNMRLNEAFMRFLVTVQE